MSLGSKAIMKKKWVSLFVSTMLATSAAWSGSFSLYGEGSPVLEGTFGAGAAAEAADASTAWYNPAGLVLLPQQFVLAGTGIFPSAKLTGTSSFKTEGIPVPYVQSFSSLEGAKDGFVPSFYYAKPLSDSIAFGLNLVAPFGLASEWSTTGPLRYAATKSKVVTTTLSPSLAAQVAENFSLGLGLDLQYANVIFNSVLGAPTISLLNPLFPPTLLDSTSTNKGHAFDIGFHIGGLLSFNQKHTRIGLNYQSQIKHKFHGTSQLLGRLADPEGEDPTAVLWTGALSSNAAALPQVVTLSGYHDLNERLALMASVVFTGWSSFSEIDLYQVAAFAPTIGPAFVNTTDLLKYRDTWRASIGANYKLNSQWILRAGTGFDETPTVAAYRDVRIPDEDRWALALGAHYQAKPNLGFDLGYTHLFVKSPTINRTDELGTSEVTVNATGKGFANIIGLQVVWNVDGVSEEPQMMTK